MKAQIACAMMVVALTGCDRQQYEYVVRYQEYAHASLDESGRRVFLTARATFVDVQSAAADPAGPERGGREMSADDRYRYVVAHPEIFGPIGSREEYEEQFGDGGAAAPADESVIEIVVSGNCDAVFTVAPDRASLTRGGTSRAAVEANPLRLATGRREKEQDYRVEGAPVALHFPALSEVVPTRERLTPWQIQRRPVPLNEPLELTLTLEYEGRARTVVFRFDRVAEHPQLPPNPLYRLYAAH